MPKRPVSGLIGILKPSGYTSMALLDMLKPLLAQSKVFQLPVDSDLQNKKDKRGTKRRRDFNRYSGGFMAPKIGQGGTLDPLADGVMVLGIGAGTKRLQQFLDCTKEYKTTALLGTSTLSYDADEPILLRKPFDHVNAEKIEEILPAFRGKFKQLPPLFSAIRIDGKRLFDYAREGRDLPRPVEKRDVEITNLELVEWLDADEHSYKEPTKECNEGERQVALRARRLAGLEAEEEAAAASATMVEETTNRADTSGTASLPPAFTLRMSVSSGTYVRSVIHDVGVQVKSAAHVVRLSRTRQGDWISPEYQVKEGEDQTMFRSAVEFDVIKQAADRLAGKADGPGNKRQRVEGGSGEEEQTATANGDEDGADTITEVGSEDELSEWEKIFLQHMQIIET